ncbi:hypothetical protein [Mesorhizobium sp. Z1-4]|uniref:hypothetical protein n=1 Tax=Mesorhizobium sp. Z1-4 TaxID=2448478 RepID=UPI000FDC92B0|nr:hypothetical protein [Mesorhizobium sp. Z1-4]
MIELFVVYASPEEAQDQSRQVIEAGLANSAIMVGARAQSHWSHLDEAATLAVYKIYDDETAPAAAAFIAEIHPSEEPEILRGSSGNGSGR